MDKTKATGTTAALATFLMDRIDEDETAARYSAAMYGPGSSLYIANHDPARALVECRAKRLIVERYTQLRRDVYGDEWEQGRAEGIGWVLRSLALPYADHEDYHPDWRL